MLRFHLARISLFSSILFVGGCNWCRPCNDGPGFFDRFRFANNTRPVVISSGDCCDSGITGPMLPGAPGSVLPAPQQNIPRIDENGKQLPWDPKTSRPGTKTGNVVTKTKEGT